MTTYTQVNANNTEMADLLKNRVVFLNCTGVVKSAVVGNKYIVTIYSAVCAEVDLTTGLVVMYGLPESNTRYMAKHWQTVRDNLRGGTTVGKPPAHLVYQRKVNSKPKLPRVSRRQHVLDQMGESESPAMMYRVRHRGATSH